MSKTAFTKTFVWSWFLLCLALLAAFLALYIKPSSPTAVHDAQSSHQVTTTTPEPEAVDLSSIVVLDCDFGADTALTASPHVRRCFDQLLNTAQPAAALEQALKQGLAQQLSSTDLHALLTIWQQYHRYHAALTTRTNTAEPEAQALQVALLRHQYFGAAQHQALFGAEAPMIQLQLEQQQILSSRTLDPVAKAEQLSALFNQTSVSADHLRPLQQHALKQLQHELRTSHASAEQVKQVLVLLG